MDGASLYCLPGGKVKYCKVRRMTNGLVTFFFSIKGRNRNSVLVFPSKQRLHKLRFLQKLGLQKPCWDQARLL